MPTPTTPRRRCCVREGARGVELAPTKWRAAPFDAPAADVAELRARWEDRGLPIVALQSLLFGRPELQLLAGDLERQALLDHLRKVADFAAAVGAKALVFGSPKNRVRGERPLEESMHIARDAFRTLAPHARDRGVVFCIEANPPAYGCDFITQTSEAVELCRLADDSSIRVNADLGGMILAGEDPASAIAQRRAIRRTRSRQRAASRPTVDGRRARARRVGARAGADIQDGSQSRCALRPRTISWGRWSARFVSPSGLTRQSAAERRRATSVSR